MRILPPSEQVEQFNIYEFENWVPEAQYEILVDGENVAAAFDVPGQLPDTSYRVRWNERTESWTCDWFDEEGAVIDQGRRLSINNWLRTPWFDAFRPTPMPSWIAFVDTGNTGAECTFEGFGRESKLVEYNIQDLADGGAFGEPGGPNVTVTIIS